MTTGRPPLPLGTHGSIRVERTATGYRARARFRDFDGITRDVKRTGRTKGAARATLTAALAERATPAGDELTRDSRFDTAVDLWIADRERANLASNTMRRYREIARDYVKPALGNLRIHELTVPRIERFIRDTSDRIGAPTARLARTAVSGAAAVAVRHGALATNPVREISGITSAPRDPHALTPDQVRATRAAILEWQTPAAGKVGRPRTLPLLDIVDMLLATGARIGEILALRWSDVDLETGSITITGTVAFTDSKPARPYRQEHPKADSSRRTLQLPPHAVAILTRRRVTSTGNAHDLVFPTDKGTVRDPSNLRSRLSAALKPAGLEWITPHSFRRTVATALDAAETTRHAADQLGHAGEDVTRRHYVQRSHAGPDVRDHLQALFD